jgi:hypothetical protein
MVVIKTTCLWPVSGLKVACYFVALHTWAGVCCHARIAPNWQCIPEELISMRKTRRRSMEILSSSIPQTPILHHWYAIGFDLLKPLDAHFGRSHPHSQAGNTCG